MSIFYTFVVTLFFAHYNAANGNSGLKSKNKPNFVYVLCDDMGLLMGDEAAIPQTLSMVKNKGAHFNNFFVSSPKCTPSRSAWLSGRYYHNLRPNGAHSGRGLNTTNFFDHDALFPTLHRNGYQTGIFGKIHNDQSRWLCQANNHTEPFTHIETECSPCGGYYRTNWVMKEDDNDVTHLLTIRSDAYSEAEYGNRSIAWIRKVATTGKPFFAYVGTTGPHLGVVPAPWHRTITENLNITAPRTPNFNMLASDHFPLLSSAPKLDEYALQFIDRHMRDRWGALFSIDDLVAGLINTLEEIGVLDNTYVLFSSDHGYHLGQFRIPDEKMLPYETDIRIPFYIRGPGIKSGMELNALGANVDVAPTLLELANIPIPNIMDGKSLVPMLFGKPYPKWRTSFLSEFAEGGVQKWGTNGMWKLKPGHPSPIKPARMMPSTDAPGNDIVSPCPAANYVVPTRCQAACDANPKCEAWTFHFNQGGSAPGWRCCQKWFAEVLHKSNSNTTSGVKDPSKPLPGELPGDGRVSPPDKPQSGGSEYIYDIPANQWRLLRVLNETDDFTFIEFDQKYVFEDVTFREFYDLSTDPWQQHNTWKDLPLWRQNQLRSDIDKWYNCRGNRTTPSTCI